MKAILIDDELAGIETLQWMITNFSPQINVVKSFTSPKEALRYLQVEANTPDVVFLDIQMDELNGFDLLASINKINFEVIFVTAHDDYAIRALKSNALDYLLKPIDKDDFDSSVSRLEAKVNQPSTGKLRLLIDQIKKERPTEKIAISTSKGYEMVAPNEIIYCESDGNYTKIHLTSGHDVLISKTLKLVEESLPPEFLRVHNSILVNINHIKNLAREDGGYLVMDNNAKIAVAKNRRSELLSKYYKI